MIARHAGGVWPRPPAYALTPIPVSVRPAAPMICPKAAEPGTARADGGAEFRRFVARPAEDAQRVPPAGLLTAPNAVEAEGHGGRRLRGDVGDGGRAAHDPADAPAA